MLSFSMVKKYKDRFSFLGPGLMYAAAAIGVSHLVQSTRAGADFGFQLIWVLILANIFKYPFFRIGPQYTAVTGKSLLHGYKEIGPWAVYLFIAMTLGTMFVIQAAVTIVTAGLAINMLGLSLSAPIVSVLILLICGAILIIGKYNILDNFIKVIIIVLTITTTSSLLFSLSADFPKTVTKNIFSWQNNGHVLFLIALIGWMPAPLDIPVWHSMWAIEKNKKLNKKIDIKDSLFDFNIGYIGTAILALCFLSLGSLVLYRSGTTLSSSAIVFSGQLISMYTETIGDWAFYPISIAAFTTMFSTSLTCLDAFPRVLSEALLQLKSKDNTSTIPPRNTYILWSFIVIVGPSIILFKFTRNMKQLIDFATTLSFVMAPIYAYLNIKVMNSIEMKNALPSKAMKILSYLGLVSLGIFTIYYLVILFR